MVVVNKEIIAKTSSIVLLIHQSGQTGRYVAVFRVGRLQLEHVFQSVTHRKTRSCFVSLLSPTPTAGTPG